MNIHHMPSCFITITRFMIHVGNNTSWSIHALINLASSTLINMFLSPPLTCFFCFTSLVLGFIISLFSMTSLFTHTMYEGFQAKTFLYFLKMLISSCVVTGDRLVPMLTNHSGPSALMTIPPLGNYDHKFLASFVISFGFMIL